MLKFLMVCLMVDAIGLVNCAPAPQLPPDLLELMTLPAPPPQLSADLLKLLSLPGLPPAPLPALPPLPGAPPPLLPTGPSSQVLTQSPTANLPAVNNLKDLFTLLSLLKALKQLS